MFLTDKKKNKKTIDFIVFISPFFLTLTWILLYHSFQPTYELFAVSELAYTIKIFYSLFTLISSFLCLFISIKLYKKSLFSNFTIYLFCCFVLFLFLFLELIHYGQKVYSPEPVKEPQALHEFLQMRLFFEATFVFVGFYGSFYWIRFIKKPMTLKSSLSRLFVPDWSLLFYFFPIIIFTLIGIGASLEYIAYLAMNADFTSVIEKYSWLFKHNPYFTHYSRLLLSIGLFIFFLKNSMWIQSCNDISRQELKNHSKRLMILSMIFFFFVMFCGAIGSKLPIPAHVDMAWGKYFELNNDIDGALFHYNECIKKGDNAHVRKELFFLYYRMGNDEAATRHLSESIKKSLASGNFTMATELYRIALYFYPNTVIDPEKKIIYFLK